MSTRRVSAIIVTRNNRRDIAACLASLRASREPLEEVIVVDHDSTDGTSDLVRREFPESCMLDFLDNPGFGEGNNRGARASSGEYLLLLNPDATVAPDCIERLVAEMDARPDSGIAVPKVVLAAEPSILNSAGLCVNTIGYGWDRGYLEWDSGQYDRHEPVLAGSGCALLVRASVFLALGGFDARYFLYYEDFDLCWRSWISGHPVRYVPTAVVRHAMKVSSRSSFYNDYLDHRNRLLTLVKNASRSWLRRIAPVVLSFEVTNVMDMARRSQWRAIRCRTQAWNWNLGHVGGTLRHRRQVQRGRRIADEELAGQFAKGTSAPRLKAALPSYREAYEHLLDRDRLAPALTMGANDVGALGLGWHGVEAFDGRPSRWCCGYGIAFLRAPAQCDTGVVRISCCGVRPVEVIVRIDRQERGRFQVNPGVWVDLDVHASFSRDIVRVEIVVAPTFVPSESDPRSPDHRTLGIAVARILID